MDCNGTHFPVFKIGTVQGNRLPFQESRAEKTEKNREG